jgi:ubiquinone/menaquinone biosynthesis C-methylase UbiE
MKIKKKRYWKEIFFFDKFFLKILKYNREKIFNIFKKNIQIKKNYNLIDIGTSPILEDYENMILQKYPWKHKILCFSNQDCSILKKKFPDIKTKKGNGLDTKIPSNSFDIVYSSATIEHVGSFLNQKKFVKELFRISKKYIFITTPNRYFPFEFHTKLPLLHYLPKNIFRFLLKLFGDNFFSKEKNLNLLTKKEIFKICSELNIKNFHILVNKFLLIDSNYILLIIK